MGEKFYVCFVVGCNKRYFNLSDRYKYIWIYLEIKFYFCKVVNCFKRYIDLSFLRKYYKIIYGKDMIVEE